MPSKPKVVPKFASEEEELRFWDEHDPSDYAAGPADVIVRLKRERKRQITMRIDEPLYQELRVVAAKHGLPYQRLMRELVRQSLAELAAEKARVA
jgi:predicted DNA binding CopG/RHH family protein